jgi:hypothetical protein
MTRDNQEEPKPKIEIKENDPEDISSFINKINAQNKLLKQIIEELELKQHIKK